MVIYVFYLRILSMHLAEFWKIYELLNFTSYQIGAKFCISRQHT